MKRNRARNPFWALALFAAAAGCGSNAIENQAPPKPRPITSAAWNTDLTAALAEARRSNRPLLVVSVVGDLTTRC